MDPLIISVLKDVILKGAGLSLENSVSIRNDSSTPEQEAVSAEALLAYAKIEQELTITRRTLISEVVEIEEYYGKSLKGGAAAKVNHSGFNIGACGEGERVTKRVIRFTGFNSQVESILNSLEASLLTKLKLEVSSASQSHQKSQHSSKKD
ncbi:MULTISPECIES: hypothetical protein [Enterobacter]|uniref:hypothetical protein n=1 Tax=Enterobacter TaxID=547 RepID=UPI00077BF391|nr:hypothetical protein [Enterobacter pseudoroggenkampii]WJW84121.1 hypothetical protein QVH39_12615 [Enterobacter pseudoroggenkampii]